MSDTPRGVHIDCISGESDALLSLAGEFRRMVMRDNLERCITTNWLDAVVDWDLIWFIATSWLPRQAQMYGTLENGIWA